MAYNYVVTAYKPCKVTHTCVAHFLHPKQRNLLVAKIDRIEVYKFNPDGLELVETLSVFGRVCGMVTFRPSPKRAGLDSKANGATHPGFDQDYLALYTDKHNFCVLRWDYQTRKCVTVVSAEDRDEPATASVHRVPLCIVDPSASVVGIHYSDQMVKIFPLDGAHASAAGADGHARVDSQQTFRVRLVVDEIVDMVFLDGCSRPTLAVLCRDEEDIVSLRTFTVSIADQDIAAGPWMQPSLDPSSTRLVPLPSPYGGVVVIGDISATYVCSSGLGPVRNMEPAAIHAVGQVDQNGGRFLMGDQGGRLLMLSLDLDESQQLVRGIDVQPLGLTSIASSIAYLDNAIVFIGSEFGDSQLVKLNAVPDEETGVHTEIMHSYQHLGPILDFCIAEGVGNLRQGQGQVVTCSGAFKEGSLRVIRNGIGISEQASLELVGMKDIWSLRENYSDRYHTYLMLSFASETRLLGLDTKEQALEEVELPNIDLNSQTLFACNMLGSLIAQVVSTSIRLSETSTMTDSSSRGWTAPEDSRILVAAGNATQVVLAMSGGELKYFELDTSTNDLVEKTTRKVENEVSCLDCSPLGPPSDNGTCVNTTAKVAAVGFWAGLGAKQPPTVQLISLPSLAPICTVSLDADVMARSVLMASLGQHDYLLIALGDGHLLSYSYKPDAGKSGGEGTVAKAADPPVRTPMMISSEDPAQPGVTTGTETGSGADVRSVLQDKRRLSVGTQPAALSMFSSRGANHVFAACDRPTVVYAETGGSKLLVSNVNQEQVTRVCGFDTALYPECLAIATESHMKIGAVDQIQKLHIQTIPLGMNARRIVHLPSHGAYAILTGCVKPDEDSEEDEVSEHHVRLIDDLSFETLDSQTLRVNEVGLSLCVAKFKGEGIPEDTEYCVVGTAFEDHADAVEPKAGRLLVFAIENKRLVEVGEHSVTGAAYCLCPFNGLLLAGVNMRTMVFSVSALRDDAMRLSVEAEHRGHTVVWKIRARGEFVLVGDIMRSVSLLRYVSAGTRSLEQLARDYDMVYTMALEVVEDDTYILAEHSKNMVALRRNSSANTDAERMKLDRVGQIHIGAVVNKLELGSLVMQSPEDFDSPVLKTMLFGTVDGMLGVVATLKKEAYKFFTQVQKAMTSVVAGVGGMSHSHWREFSVSAPQRRMSASGFIDGDLVEQFLELDLQEAAKVADAVGVPVEELTRRVEEMHRIH